MLQRVRKKTLSGQLEWNGFRATAYSLDTHKIWELPVKLSEEENKEIAIGEVLSKLRDAELVEVEAGIDHLRVKLSTGEEEYRGPSFYLSLLEIWLRLHKVNANAFYAKFFYYDSDSVTDDPHDSYTFFVVCNDKIVDERVSFHDYSRSGFDPAVLQVDDRKDRIWSNDTHWNDAWRRFWYRKFYQETRTGQLMVLRPDQPDLYFYPDGRRWPVTTWNAPSSRTISLPGITVPLFPRIYRNRNGCTYNEWLYSDDESGDWSPENPDPSLITNSRFEAVVGFIGNLFQWAYILGLLYIAVGIVRFMWNHPPFAK